MHLVVDIGNTRAKYAVFDGKDIVFAGTILKRFSGSIMKKIPSEYILSAAILSNTSQPDPRLLNALGQLPVFIHLSHLTKLPIKNHYGTPESLGKDRLAAAAGAFARIPGQQTLIIDMGTCITMNFLTASGEFTGGNISPGIRMRLKAMHKFTAKLPLVDPLLHDEYFATTTVKALQNGAVKGTFREIDSFIEETRLKFGEINVFLTGGDANFFESYSKNKIFVAPNLVLEGLNEILKYNVE